MPLRHRDLPGAAAAATPSSSSPTWPSGVSASPGSAKGISHGDLGAAARYPGGESEEVSLGGREGLLPTRGPSCPEHRGPRGGEAGRGYREMTRLLDPLLLETAVLLLVAVASTSFAIVGPRSAGGTRRVTSVRVDGMHQDQRHPGSLTLPRSLETRHAIDPRPRRTLTIASSGCSGGAGHQLAAALEDFRCGERPCQRPSRPGINDLRAVRVVNDRRRRRDRKNRFGHWRNPGGYLARVRSR